MWGEFLQVPIRLHTIPSPKFWAGLSASQNCRQDMMLHRPAHNTSETFKNSVLTLKTHQMFSLHITPEKLESAATTGCFRFLFEENSVRKLT